MGIDRKTLAWLDKDLTGHVLTLGRQHWCDGQPLEQREYFDQVFAERALIESLDNDQTIHPTFCHDLNQPLGESFANRYNLIIDGGTLEHVFNVPVALESIRRSLKLNGVFASIQLLNLNGHGFWSLTPELLWKWSAANGFEHQECEIKRIGKYATPCKVKVNSERLELTSTVPLMMFFKARKVADVTGTPQQAGPCLDHPLKFWAWTARLWRHHAAIKRLGCYFRGAHAAPRVISGGPAGNPSAANGHLVQCYWCDHQYYVFGK
jgi:hypothetical protein